MTIRLFVQIPSMLKKKPRNCLTGLCAHYADVIMIEMATQITSLAIVYSTVYSDADQRKHQSSASLAFVRGIHRGPVNSPHKWPVTRKMFPLDDVIMWESIGSRRIPRFPSQRDSYTPDSKVHWAYMGPTWGRQDPGGPHVGPMNLTIRDGKLVHVMMSSWYWALGNRPEHTISYLNQLSISMK